ncbi:hypothetical protein FRB96_006549 [Tulasnella sp. 330]|nr:hypothetical protein FRB96_006549 [Tulasnella sp. 330]KAG8879003.1 hypothetical protein FRB98_005885 [Tulasnella sp. 332]
MSALPLSRAEPNAVETHFAQDPDTSPPSSIAAFVEVSITRSIPKLAVKLGYHEKASYIVTRHAYNNIKVANDFIWAMLVEFYERGLDSGDYMPPLEFIQGDNRGSNTKDTRAEYATKGDTDARRNGGDGTRAAFI